MNIRGKIQDPIVIRLSKKSNIIMPDKVNKEECLLEPGAIFGGQHYGFVLIIDHNGKQEEVVYSTQCRISAVGMQDNILNIYEEGKRMPWKFTKSGKLKQSINEDSIDEFMSDYSIISDSSMFSKEKKMENPLKIKIVRTHEVKSFIMKDELVNQDYPLSPGVVLGTEHYGFIFYIETLNGCKEKYYPTENKIDAVVSEGNEWKDVDIKIYENGKYNPWIFTNDGIFKQEASYNPYSRRDRQYMDKVYELNNNEDRHFIK